MSAFPSGVAQVLETLENAGYTPYLVGGCVRDLLRGAPPADYDLTSDALPEAVLSLFGTHAHPTGLPHGTVTVVCGGEAIEVTTMRCDGAYRDNRHPEQVQFTRDITQDLARRDFTVNAIAMRPDGTLVDPFGGQADLHAGLLRCVGTPEVRFAEDALRILRLLRFAATLGFAVDPSTAQAAHECRPRLGRIAHERIFAELNGMLCGDHAAEVLRTFPDILGVVLPEILPCVGFDQHNHHHAFDVWEHTLRAVALAPNDPALRWTMLFHDLGKPACFSLGADGEGHFYGHTAVSAEIAEQIMARLHFDNATRNAVRTRLACFDEAIVPPELSALRKIAVRYGRPAVRGLICTKYADNGAKGDDAPQKMLPLRDELFRLADQLDGLCCSVGELAIDGNDIAQIGFAGKSVGQVLQKLLDEVAAERLDNTPDALRARAMRLWRSGYAKT